MKSSLLHQTESPVIWFLVFGLFAVAVFTSGCVVARRVPTSATEVRLKVKTMDPLNCSVRLISDRSRDFPVNSNGTVVVEIPKRDNGCDWYLFGTIKLRDGSTANVPAIAVSKTGKVVRTLSSAQIRGLPFDEEGNRVVGLGE